MTIVNDYLPEARWQSKITPTQIILHTAVDGPGPTNLQDYFERRDIRTESHYWIPFEGPIVRMMPTTPGEARRADANRYANKRPDGTGAISIETEDDGTPEVTPWSRHQLNGLKEIIWLESERHGIPLTRCEHPADPGIGYHSMWGAPSAWTPYWGKTCPGSARIAQFDDLLIDLNDANEVVPFEFDPPFMFDANGVPVRSAYSPPSGGTYHITEDGHLYAYGCPWGSFPGAPAGQDYWGDRKAAQIVEPTPAGKASGKRYRIVATNGQDYQY